MGYATANGFARCLCSRVSGTTIVDGVQERFMRIPNQLQRLPFAWVNVTRGSILYLPLHTQTFAFSLLSMTFCFASVHTPIHTPLYCYPLTTQASEALGWGLSAQRELQLLGNGHAHTDARLVND